MVAHIDLNFLKLQMIENFKLFFYIDDMNGDVEYHFGKATMTNGKG